MPSRASPQMNMLFYKPILSLLSSKISLCFRETSLEIFCHHHPPEMHHIAPPISKKAETKRKAPPPRAPGSTCAPTPPKTEWAAAERSLHAPFHPAPPPDLHAERSLHAPRLWRLRSAKRLGVDGLYLDRLDLGPQLGLHLG